MTTKPQCLPSHSWCRSPDVVPGRWEDHRVPFSRIIVDGKSLPGMPKNSPSLHTTTACNLWTIIKSNSSMGTMWEKLRQLKPPWGPEASFLLVWTNPVSAFQKDSIWIKQKKRVLFFFLDLKSSPENCALLSPSLKRVFLLSQGLSNGEHSNNYRSQHLLSTHYVPSPMSCGLLSTFPSTLESRYHYYPHFQRGKPGSKRFSILPQNTQLVKCKVCLFTQANLVSKIWLHDTSVNCYVWIILWAVLWSCWHYI